tara:strand:- start:525 stop:806 length:282 start_codon:yes stop_codon:yes gene_type:complete
MDKLHKNYMPPVFEIGDLVYYYDTYVIPPDAVNWKFTNDEDEDYPHKRMGIVVEIKEQFHEVSPLYRIMWIKDGTQRTCASVNLRKVYPNESI